MSLKDFQWVFIGLLLILMVFNAEIILHHVHHTCMIWTKLEVHKRSWGPCTSKLEVPIILPLILILILVPPVISYCHFWIVPPKIPSRWAIKSCKCDAFSLLMKYFCYSPSSLNLGIYIFHSNLLLVKTWIYDKTCKQLFILNALVGE